MNTTLQSREKQTLPLGQLRKTNIRDYAMYIVLVVLFVVFGILTNGLFLSPRNLTDLINQTGYVAVLAIGITLTTWLLLRAGVTPPTLVSVRIGILVAGAAAIITVIERRKRRK